MNLTKYEMETIINFNDAKDNAQIYTCNKALMRKLDSYCQKSQLIYREKTDECSKTYIIPKKYIQIRFPREISDEKRRELSERAKTNFHSEEGLK